MSSNSGAYDHIVTHRRITERVLTESNLNTYLKQNLGISDGSEGIENGQGNLPYGYPMVPN